MASLVYAPLGNDNGGIVLDVSEIGLSIRLAMPLGAEGIYRLHFQLPQTGNPIELSGRVAWVGDSRKEVAVEFVDLTSEARQSIQEWMAFEASGGGVSQDAPRAEAPDTRPPDYKKSRGPARRATRFASAMARSAVPEIPAKVPSELLNPSGETARAESDPRVEQVSETPETSRSALTELPDQPGDAPVQIPPPVILAGGSPFSESTHEISESPVQTPHQVSPQRVVETSEKVSTNLASQETERTGASDRSDSLAAEPDASHVMDLRPPFNSVLFGGQPAHRATDRYAGASEISPYFSSRRGLERGGWLALAALVCVLIVIAFEIGVAVGRGALEQFYAPFEKRQPQPASAPQAVEPPSLGSSAAAPDSQSQSAANPQSAAAPTADGQDTHSQDASSSTGSSSPDSPANPTPTPDSAASGPNPPPAASLAGAPWIENPVFPMDLPEEAVSASSSVAISSHRIIPPPPGFDAHNPPKGVHLAIGERTRRVEPLYPKSAIEQRTEGKVRLRIRIGADGTVETVENLGGPPLLVPAAIEAVRGWHYAKTYLNGRPIETQEDVNFIFRLPNNLR